MRLIDVDALLDFIHNGQGKEWFNSTSNRLTASDCVNAQPTVDAVEVVRCAECRFSKPIPEHAAKAFNAELVRDCTYQRGDWKQVYGFSVVSVDGYCDEGERRMDGEGEKDG